LQTPSITHPPDLPAIRRWLAEHAPDVDEVRSWTGRVLTRLEAIGTVPALGSPDWATLADTDARKLAAALSPALAHLVDRTPAAIAERLRAELDAHAREWRRALVDAHADVAQGWRGYGIGPSHAELDRRRYTFPCGQCRRPLRFGISACDACGWREPTPAELRARARESTAHYLQTADEQGAA
jgi:hypothetical protein